MVDVIGISFDKGKRIYYFSPNSLELNINDKVIVYPNTIISKGDIISFKKCGKIKFIEEIRKTKNSNVVIRVFKYS